MSSSSAAPAADPAAPLSLASSAPTSVISALPLTGRRLACNRSECPICLDLLVDTADEFLIFCVPSGSEGGFLSEPLPARKLTANDYHLPCSCFVHYHCLVSYLHVKMGDRSSFSAQGGFSCPFGAECKGLTSSTSAVHTITPADLETFINHATQHEEELMKILKENGIEPLTHEKVTELRAWLEEREVLDSSRAWLGDLSISRDEIEGLSRVVEAKRPGSVIALNREMQRQRALAQAEQIVRSEGADSDDTPILAAPRLEVRLVDDAALKDECRLHLSAARQANKEEMDPMVLASTKACPSCGARSTHYHGHNCHHISPHGGCPSCHINYCYRCLSTEIDNQAERNGFNRCKCGSWSNYCLPIRSGKDIIKYIVPLPVAYDRRCGCVICPDCLFGQPCDTCPGNCAVCLGVLNPGSREIKEEYSLEGPGNFFDLDKPLPILQEACRHGDLAACADALEQRRITPFDINTVDHEGQSCLYYACDAGYIDCVSLMLEKCADIDVNLASKYGYTPLIIACKDGFAALAEVLISSGRILANLQSRNGYTALYVACCNGHLEAVQLLLSHTFDPPLDINLADATGHTSLHMAARNGHLVIVKLLLQHSSINIIKVTSHGSTASFWAECNHHTEIVAVLKAKAMEIKEKHSRGRFGFKKLGEIGCSIH